jgi:GNAT superfamily N-acetyltransferase
VAGRGSLPAELTVSSYADVTVSARLAGPATVVVTARRQGEAVGLATAVLAVPGPGAWLLGLDVAVPARRTGVGAQLISRLAAALAERGAEVMRVPAPGPPAEGFLARMGFRPASGEVWERRL